MVVNICNCISLYADDTLLYLSNAMCDLPQVMEFFFSVPFQAIKLISGEVEMIGPLDGKVDSVRFS